MKKPLLFIFAFCYLGLSCGFAIDIHFCMGRVSSVDWINPGKNTCTKCGMKSRKGCCDSKTTVVKITDSQQLSYTDINITAPVTFIVDHYNYAFSERISQLIRDTFDDTSPPPVPGAFLRILHSTFTI